MQTGLTIKYREILDYIIAKKSASVSELSSVFFLSESTVRRILAEMERKKLVERFHGGAIAPGAAQKAQKLESRRTQRIREKAAIAREAAELVSDGMTLMLLGGTTVSSICPYIKGKSITVITSSIPVINCLLPEERMKLILLGGIVNPPELEVRGTMAAAGLERLRADMLFIGATCVHPMHGLMTDDPEAVATYRACLLKSDKKILLADSTKFKAGGVTVVAALSELDGVITDEGLPEEAVALLHRQNIPVTISKLS